MEYVKVSLLMLLVAVIWTATVVTLTRIVSPKILGIEVVYALTFVVVVGALYVIKT